MTMKFQRAHFLAPPEWFNLNFACKAINSAFGGLGTYLVGSALEHKDYRDVDVRTILTDEEYDRLIPPQFAGENRIRNQNLNPFWTLLCAAISQWLSQQSGLRVDWQLQRMTDANEEHDGKRNALGMFLESKP